MDAESSLRRAGAQFEAFSRALAEGRGRTELAQALGTVRSIAEGDFDAETRRRARRLAITGREAFARRAEERTRKRAELLGHGERALARLRARVRRKRQPLRGEAEIGKALGALCARGKVAKHFEITITDDDLSFRRDQASIDAEAALDGFYVLRTSLPAKTLDAEGTKSGTGHGD